MSIATETTEIAALRAELRRLNDMASADINRYEQLATRFRAAIADRDDLKKEVAHLKPKAVAYERCASLIDKIDEHGVRRLGQMFLDPAEIIRLEHTHVEWRDCVRDVASAGSEREAEEAMDRWLEDEPQADYEDR